MKVNVSNFKLNKSACPHFFRKDDIDMHCVYCGYAIYSSQIEERQQLKRTRVEDTETSISSSENKKEANYSPPRKVQNGRVISYEQLNKYKAGMGN